MFYPSFDCELQRTALCILASLVSFVTLNMFKYLVYFENLSLRGTLLLMIYTSETSWKMLKSLHK